MNLAEFFDFSMSEIGRRHDHLVWLFLLLVMGFFVGLFFLLCTVRCEFEVSGAVPGGYGLSMLFLIFFFFGKMVALMV